MLATRRLAICKLVHPNSNRLLARLGFALLLKFFEIDARFPGRMDEIPIAAVEFVAEQVKVPASALESYDWSGRSITLHRGQIRKAFSFRECSEGDK